VNDIVEPILGINVRITWDVWNAEMRIPLDFKWIATIRNKPAICGVQHNYTVTLDTWVFQRVPFPMHPRANITGIHHGYIWSIYWSSIMGIFCIHTSIHPYLLHHSSTTANSSGKHWESATGDSTGNRSTISWIHNDLISIGMHQHATLYYGGFHSHGGTPLSLDGLFHGKS